MPLERQNYVVLIASVVLIVAGYVVMALANSTEDPAHSPLALTVAPLILLTGYLGAAAAVLWRPRSQEDVTVESDTATKR